MLGKCFLILTIVSFGSAIYTGSIEDLSKSVLDGAGEAVELCIALLGMMCLWCGIMEVLREAGVVSRMSRLLSPILLFIFPDAYKSGVATDKICAVLAANMLGVANAATPFAISAMKSLDEANGCSERSSPDMVTLTVLGASSVSLMPTTVISMLYNEGSTSPYSVILPIWICSSICAVFGVVLCRITAGRRH